jgi:hypothetical protein
MDSNLTAHDHFPAGLLDSQVAPLIKPLTFDHTPSVREAYYQALAHWLGCSSLQQQGAAADGSAAAAAAAHARCRTYAHVLLPLLLLGISDPQESIAAATLRAVEQTGEAWQLQPAAAALAAAAAGSSGSNGSTDVTPMETDAPADSSAAAAASASSSSNPAAEALQVSPAAIAAAHLPPPYQGLPSNACRQMAATLLPQLLPLVLSGLREWTVSLRSAGVRLLHTSLVLSGPAVTPYLAQLLPGLVSAMSDDDNDVIKLLASSCRLVGAFVPASAWLPLLVDAVSDPKSGPASKANALVVLSCLTHAAAAAGQQASDPQLLQVLVRALASEEVLGCDHAGMQTQLLIVVENLLVWMPPATVSDVRQELYLILLQLHGAASAAAGSSSAAAAAGQPADSSSGQVGRALAVMQRLAESTGLPGGINQLAQAHAQQLLSPLTSDVGKWGSGSQHLLTFTSLLQTAGAGCLSELLPQVAQVKR